MGLDPENPDYEIGIDNPQCHVPLFASETPKYVEVHIEGVIKCFPWAPDPPNGAFLLTQQAGGTVWLDTDPDLGISYELTNLKSEFFVIQFIGGFPRIWFQRTSVVLCRTTFTNIPACPGLPTIGAQGTAEIFWGPAIHT